MTEISSLVEELEDAIASGTEHRRIVALRRVTDLFIAGSNRYSIEQVALFDEVLLCLTQEIEQQARASLAQRLAKVENAPPRVIRSLAFDDAAEVATPVLISSPRLTDDDLIANAETKSQGHLYAISQRATLSEGVTDVLVDRGDQRVVRTVADNRGARFSNIGFGKLVERAKGDSVLARIVGARPDIPRHHFLKLLDSASAAARATLIADNPQAAGLIRDTVAEIANNINREVREASPEHVRAKRAAKRRHKNAPPSEADVHRRAQAQDFERTVIALAVYGGLSIDLVERALLDQRPDMVLILAKAAGCSRTTTKAILMMQAAGRGMSEADLTQALASFDRLSKTTAKRVLEFYDRRIAHAHSAMSMDLAEITSAVA
jgi:uncharacterized protein (DUF2336 family)